MKTFPIKWASFIAFFFSVNLLGNQMSSPSYILEIKKNSKLFNMPSSKSKIIGQADEGTFLIFLQKSKKGFWIKVQDSDGFAGWLPRNITDYDDIEKSLEYPKQNQSNLEREGESSRENKIQSVFHNRHLNYRLAPFFRHYSQPTIIPSFTGLRFDFQLPSNGLAKSKKNILSVEAGVASHSKKLTDGYLGSMRFGEHLPISQSFFYGLDYGYSFQNLNSIFRHHFSLGLSAGKDFSRFDFRTRFGYEFFSHSQATFEVQLGCWF